MPATEGAVNETALDVQREDWVAGYLERQWGCTIRKLTQKSYEIDWSLFKQGKLWMWGEFKYRDVPWGTYDTVLLSAAKFSRLQELSRNTSRPCVFVTAWKGGTVAFHKWPLHNGLRYTIVWGGSGPGTATSTNSRNNEEPCIQMPARDFETIHISRGKSS